MRVVRRFSSIGWPRLLGSLVLLCTLAIPSAFVVQPTTTVHAAQAEVKMENFKFAPAAITVAAGDTISWTNTDNFTHNVTVDQGPQMFVTSELKPGESTQIAFKQPGNYHYFCEWHPFMQAT